VTKGSDCRSQCNGCMTEGSDDAGCWRRMVTVLCACCICGCRSHCDGCMVGVTRFVAICVDRCRFATGCCKTHCNGCMNVAWALL